MSIGAAQLSLARIDSGAAEHESTCIREAVARNAAALELLLVNDRGGKFYRVAFSILRNREDAEDALQEGLQRAFSRLHTFEGRSSLFTWVTQIVINSALIILRRKKCRSEHSLNEIMENQAEWATGLLLDKHLNPEQIYACTELNEQMQKGLLGFSAFEQVAFHHYAIEGHSMKECSERFGVSRSAFKSRISRMRRKLADKLNHLPNKALVGSSKAKKIDGDLSL